jgi:hypothetical protein
MLPQSNPNDSARLRISDALVCVSATVGSRVGACIKLNVVTIPFPTPNAICTSKENKSLGNAAFAYAESLATQTKNSGKKTSRDADIATSFDET